jgi:hypothetical protein
MHFNGSGGGTVVTVGPGRYFVVGARGSDPIFSVPNNVILQDMSPPSEAPTNQGEIFVFTDHRYPGLEIPGELSGVLNQFTYGWVDIQTGNNDNSAINLHGLNRTFSLPDNLANFSPTVLWWDQGNAQIDYNPDGSINWDDNGNAVLNPDTSIDPFMHLQAGPNTDLYGVLYMPRGSYLDFQGSPEMSSPLMLIAGSITITGGGEINLPRPSMPLLRKVVALIE